MALSLNHYGIPNHLQSAFWALYEGHTFRIKYRGCCSSARSTGTGLKQGDRLSPIIFNLALQYVLECSCRKNGVTLRAVPLQPPEVARDACLSLLLYAGDIANINPKFSDAVKSFKELVGNFEIHGLKINFGKTKSMVFNATAGIADHISVGDEKIDRVHDFDYLGSHFTDGSNRADLER